MSYLGSIPLPSEQSLPPHTPQTNERCPGNESLLFVLAESLSDFKFHFVKFSVPHFFEIF